MMVLLQHPVHCYILAIALQLSGAIMLIIYFCGNTKDRILEEYFPGSNVADRDDKGMVTLEREKIRKSATKVYLNRLAFIYIAVGYLLGVYGSTGTYGADKIAIMVLVFGTLLIIVGNLIVLLLVKILYREDWKMNYDEISYIADTFITNKEIDDLFNDD